jgi:hypothetical protein
MLECMVSMLRFATDAKATFSNKTKHSKSPEQLLRGAKVIT